MMINSHKIEIAKLAFNKKDTEAIRSISWSINQHSNSAKYLGHMNVLNIALGLIYYLIIESYQNFFIVIHGIILFFILKEYYYHKCFVYDDFKEYLKIIESFFKKKNINFERGDYIDSWTIHGSISTAAERLMVKNDLDNALQKISHKEKWLYIFNIPKIIRTFAGIPF
jgi:hypothetical protein